MFTQRITLLLLLCTGTLTGCNWINNLRLTSDDRPTGKLELRPAKEFVGYLNRQASYVNNVRYDSVRLTPTLPNQAFMPSLSSGLIVCAKPMYFRLQAGLPVGGDQVDVGSNSDEFWMFVKQSEPKYLFCSHADFPKVQEKLPVPVEPEWIMQALGMTTFPENKNYRIEISDKDRVYYLSWEDTTSSGQRVLKAVEFNGDRANSTTPQVRRHFIMTPLKNGGWETAAIAEIKKVLTKEVGMDPETRQPIYVQVPTHVLLDWPTQKMKLDLVLDRVKVNDQLSAQDMKGLFQKPAKLDNATPINLMDYRYNATPNTRGSYPGDLPNPEYRKR